MTDEPAPGGHDDVDAELEHTAERRPLEPADPGADESSAAGAASEEPSGDTARREPLPPEVLDPPAPTADPAPGEPPLPTAPSLGTHAGPLVPEDPAVEQAPGAHAAEATPGQGLSLVAIALLLSGVAVALVVGLLILLRGA